MPISEIEKNSQEVVRFDLIEFKGQLYADLRVYYEDGGEYKPSRKGLCIAPELWPDFVHGIEALSAELEARGLLDDEETEEAA